MPKLLEPINVVHEKEEQEEDKNDEEEISEEAYKPKVLKRYNVDMRLRKYLVLL